jgi:restriction endonuclease
MNMANSASSWIGSLKIVANSPRVSIDSMNEREFVALLDSGTEIEVYAKLPKSSWIPTPVGATRQTGPA